MSFSKMVSQPRMFFEKFKGAVFFKQLKSHANTHRRGHLNKQMNMINTNVKLINFEPFSVSYLPQEKFTIHFEPVKLKGVFGIFNFPHKVEGVLSKAMLPRFQIHFLSPEHSSNYVHQFISGEIVSRPSDSNPLTELNLMEHGSPPLFERESIQA